VGLAETASVAGFDFSCRPPEQLQAAPANQSLVLLFASLLAIPLACQCGLHTTFFAGLQIVGMTLYFLDDVFLLDLALEPAQCILERLAFLNTNLCQINPPPNLPRGNINDTGFAQLLKAHSKSCNGRIDSACRGRPRTRRVRQDRPARLGRRPSHSFSESYLGKTLGTRPRQLIFKSTIAGLQLFHLTRELLSPTLNQLVDDVRRHADDTCTELPAQKPRRLLALRCSECAHSLPPRQHMFAA
jgi:hypothetical protein